MHTITITNTHDLDAPVSRRLPRPGLARRIRLAITGWLRNEQKVARLQALADRQRSTIESQIKALARMAETNQRLRAENVSLCRSRAQLLRHRGVNGGGVR